MSCGCNNHCGSNCNCGCHGHGVVAGPALPKCAKKVPPVKLATYIIPAQLGTDAEGEKYAPQFGKFHNTVVWYQANDAIYLYDGEGQYTFIAKRGEIEAGDTGYITGEQVNQLKEALEKADQALQENIDSEAADREEADKELQAAIDAEAEERKEAIEGLEADLDEETQAREEEDNNLQSQIDAMAASTDVIDVVDTHADLESYNTENVHLNDIIKVLNDETHDGAITYYRWDGSTWNYVGSTGPYYTKAETDEKITEAISTVDIPERAKNLPTKVFYDWYGLTPQYEQDKIRLGFLYKDLDTGGTSNTQKDISAATSTKAGVMSAEDKRNLDALVEGGGGSSVELAEEYGDSSTTALSQKFLSGKLNGNSVSLGKTAQAGTYGTAVGSSTRTSSRGTAIGYEVEATGDYSTAIGYTYTKASNDYSVALGHHSQTKRASEVSIGDGSSDANYGTRFIANVRAGEKDLDAVNLKQVREMIAEGGGGSSVELLSSYAPSPTDAQAYSAGYVNGRLDGSTTAIGVNAKAGSNGDIAIGPSSAAQTGLRSIAIGSEAVAGNGYGYSVALGAQSKVGRQSEVSIGGGSSDTTKTRYLANVKAGTLDTDAVNLGQMNAVVGDIQTVLESINGD